MRPIILRMERYMPARINVCSTTATEVTAMKARSKVVSFILARPFAPASGEFFKHYRLAVAASAVESCGAARYAGRPASDADGTVRVGSRILRRILVCLPAGFKCRTDVVFLLRDHFLAAIGPFLCLVFVLAGAFLHHVAALFRRRQQRVASLATGLGRIEDANRCANAQSRKKP